MTEAMTSLTEKAERNHSSSRTGHVN